MKFLRIGTCSWKYDSWRGLIYSNRKPLNHLAEYSRIYNTVEIDQWFWSLFGTDKIKMPSAATVREYLDSVPPDFDFTVKVPNSVTLTHFYRNKNTDPLIENPHFLSEGLFEDFLGIIEPMRNQIGCLMFQFEYLNRQKMPSQGSFQEKFSSFLEKTDNSWPYGIEIRNPNYLNERYFRFLKSHELSHVFLQGYYMPSVVDLYPKISGFLTGLTVIRLHGPDRADIEKESGGRWDRILQPKDNELKETVAIVRDLLDSKREVYINVNNHYEGSAPLSIQRLEKFLSDIETDYGSDHVPK